VLAAAGLPIGLMLVSAAAASPTSGGVTASPSSPATPLQVPSKAVPCVSFAYRDRGLTEDTELVTDGYVLAVCWPNGACHDGSTPVSRPDPPPAPATARVEPTRICTGATCDPLGPRARAAVAGVSPSLLRATTDRAMLVIDQAGETQLWSRARDLRIALPAPHRRGPDKEGGVVAVNVVGSHVMVSRSWRPDIAPPPPWLPARGTILDARGQITAVVASAATGRAGGTSIVDLADDELVVFDGAGGFTLIVHGAPIAHGDLSEWHATPIGARARSSAADRDPGPSMARTQELRVQAVALDPGSNASGETTEIDGTPAGSFHTKRFGYKWCDVGEVEGCHVGLIEIVFQIDAHGRRSEWLRQRDDRALPAC
jgi:hypothetical protein